MAGDIYKTLGINVYAEPKLKLTDDEPVKSTTPINPVKKELGFWDKVERGWEKVTAPDTSAYDTINASAKEGLAAARKLGIPEYQPKKISEMTPLELRQNFPAESIQEYKSPLSGQDIGTRIIRGATGAAVSLANAAQLGNAKDNKWILEDIAKNNEEYKLSQIKTPERLAEYQAVQKKMQDAKTLPQIASAAVSSAYDSLTHPSDANIAGFVGETMGSPVNVLLPGLGAKAGEMFANRYAGAAAGMAADTALNGGTSYAQAYLDAKRQGKSEEEAQKEGIASATVGSAVAAPLGAAFGAMGAKGKKAADTPNISIEPTNTVGVNQDAIASVIGDKAKSIHPEDVSAIQSSLAEIQKISDEYVGQNSAENIYANTLNEHEAAAAAENESIKQATKQMIEAKKDISYIQTTLDNLITPTRDDLHISDILNAGKPLPSRYTGMRIFPLLENSIKIAIEAPDAARDNQAFYQKLKSDGVGEEFANVLTKAYAAKDASIAREYAFEKLKASELMNAAKAKSDEIAKQTAQNGIIEAHRIADELIDARAAAAGMSRAEWDAMHTLETTHYPDMSKTEVDGFGTPSIDDAPTVRDIFDSVYMTQNDFKGGQYVKNDVGIRRDMIEKLDRKVSNFEQLNEKEAADYEHIKQYVKESGALEAYQKAKAEDTTPPPEMVFDESMGEYITKAEHDALMAEADALFSKADGSKVDFGEDFTQFKGRPQEAIERLLEVKSGQVTGAISHTQLGDIDFVYGDGRYGISHILEQRSKDWGEEKAIRYIKRLPEIIQASILYEKESSATRKVLYDAKNKIVIELRFNNADKHWLLTAMRDERAGKKYAEAKSQTVDDATSKSSTSGSERQGSDILADDTPVGEILSQSEIKSQVIKGMYNDLGDEHIITTFKEADFGTVLHEYGHYFRRTLDDTERAAAAEAFGVEGGKWERAHEERFAEAFVKWLSEGKEPTSMLESVFAKLKSFLAELFTANPKSHEALISLDPKQREFFAAIFGDTEAAKKIYGDMEAKAKSEAVDGVELYQKEIVPKAEEESLPPKMEEESAKTQKAIYRMSDWWDALVEKGADKVEDAVQWARDKSEGKIAGKIIHGVTVGKNEKAAARLVQDMTIAKHQINEEAAAIAKELGRLADDDRTAITRALGGDMDVSALPEHLKKDFEAMRAAIDNNTAKMVELGALAAENAHENYVKRVYKDHQNRLDAFIASAGLKLGGEGRKIVEKTYTAADADRFAKDIEAIYPSSELNLHSKSLDSVVKILEEKGQIGKIEKGKLQIIRHEDGSITTKRWLTHDERLAIGMLEDASVVVPDTIKAQQSQILKATLLKKIADQYASDIAVDGWVRVPDETVAGIKKYGALSGKYVNPEIHRTLISSRMVSDGIGLLERGLYPLMDHLKVNMTVKNPVTHLYNVGSNAMLLGLHGHTISLGKVLTMRVSDKAAFDALVKDANKYGLNSNLMDIEVRDSIKEPTKNPLAAIWHEIYMTQGSKTGDAARHIYEWEDKIFKLAAFKDKIDAYKARYDKEPTAKQKREMMDEANAEYIDYSTPLPPIFRALDKSGLMPFLHYQLKAAPMVVKAAAKHPLRWALITAGLYAANWSNIGEDEDKNKKPFWAADLANIFFAKNYVKIGDDLYWNLGRLLPGFRFGGLNLVMPNQHGELEPAGGIPGGVLRILSGSDPLGRKFGSEYDGFGEMIKDRFEEFAKAYMPSITSGRYAIATAKLAATKVGITPEYIIDAKTGEMKPNPKAPKNSYKEPMTFTELYQRMVGIRKFSAEKELERKASEAKSLKNYEVKDAKENGDLEKQLAAETEYQKTMLDLTEDGYNPQSKPSKGGGASIRLNLGMPKPKKWD